MLVAFKCDVTAKVDFFYILSFVNEYFYIFNYNIKEPIRNKPSGFYGLSWWTMSVIFETRFSNFVIIFVHFVQ